MVDLVPYRWAAATADALAWQWLARNFANHGLPTPRGGFEAASFPLRARVTASSDLLFFNSRAGFAEYAQGQHLVELKVEDIEWTRAVEVSYRKGAYLSPAARRFMELLHMATSPQSAAR